MEKIQPVQQPVPPVSAGGGVRRSDDLQGAKSVDRTSLQARFSELNRQAVVPPPDSAAGKTFGEMLDSIRP